MVAERLRTDIRAFRILAAAQVRSELTYRSTFAAFVVAQVIITAFDALAIVVIFSSVETLGGWTRGQVLFLYSVASLAFGLSDFLMGSIHYLPEFVRTGSFDKFLLRPVGVLSQTLAQAFALRRLSRVLQSVIVLVLVVTVGDIHLSAVGVVLIVVGMASAVLTFSSIFLATGTVSFWSPNTQEFASAFTFGGSFLAEYPTHIFPDWLRVFAFGLVPIGGVIYLPVMYTLGADNPLGIPTWVQLISPMIVVPAVCVAALIWRQGLRHYESTGS